jgi:chemotaxis protein methyltransferase CheR
MARLASSASIHPDNYRYLQKIIYEGSGIVIEHDKEYLLDVRLTTVARQHGLDSINDLCSLLRTTNGSPVRNQVVEAMTTNETYFFREPSHYDAIRVVLLPLLRELRATTRKLSFWSAAASSGQESYSLAMLLLEQRLAAWNVQILGTDLSSRMVDTARAGTYRQIEVNRGLPTLLLLKYFARQGTEWQLRDEVRRMVRFENFDLRQSMRSFGPFDLVFCRNVLIYFDSATRRKILGQIHGTLFPGGWLLLGTTEVASEVGEFFERTLVNGTTVYVAR